MNRIKKLLGAWLAVALFSSVFHAHAGQTPGVSTPWNGPWGGGYLNGAPYSPWSSPYVSAGYPVGAPGLYGGDTAYQPPPGPQPKQLPGGGYFLPPGPGGGILPGAYSR